MAVTAASTHSMWATFLMGSGQAVVAEGATAPFDRTKNLLQLDSELHRLGRLPPTGSVDSPFGSAVGRVLDAEGVRGLWRGFLPAIIAYFPSQALSFGLRDYFRTLLPSLWAGAASVDTTDDHPPSGPGAGNVGRVALWFATRVAAGALAGAATLTIIYPLHFASVQLMADVGRRSISGVVEHQFEGTWDVWRQAVARSGFGGLYHGLGVSLAGVLVFRGLYFGAYDLALYLLPAKLKRNDWVCFLTAVGVTVGSAFVAYPLDTIRRRVMVAALTPQAYGGALECAREIWRTEGLPGFFAGALANVLVSTVSSFVLLAFDQLLSTV